MDKLFSQMRHRITIQNKIASSDNAGGQNISWVNFKTIWAKIENTTNSVSRANSLEQNFAEQIQNKSQYEITIRYQNAINPSMRVIYDNEILNIKSINNIDEKNEYMVIYAIEEVSL